MSVKIVLSSALLLSSSLAVKFVLVILALLLLVISFTRRKRCWIDNTIWFLSTVKPQSSPQSSRIHIPGVVMKMHWMVRGIPHRILRSTNYRGEFNVLVSKERGCGQRVLILNEEDTARSSRNALSRMFARDFGTFVIKRPPEPRRVPIFGTILCLMMAGGPQKLHEYVDKRHQELGPVFREQIGPLWSVFVNSPDEFRRIFLQLEGRTPRHFLPEAWTLYNEIRTQQRGLLFMYVMFFYWHCSMEWRRWLDCRQGIVSIL